MSVLMEEPVKRKDSRRSGRRRLGDHTGRLLPAQGRMQSTPGWEWEQEQCNQSDWKFRRGNRRK